MMLDIPFIAAVYNTLLEGITKNCYRTKSKRFLDSATFGGSARNDRGALATARNDTRQRA